MNEREKRHESLLRKILERGSYKKYEDFVEVVMQVTGLERPATMSFITANLPKDVEVVTRGPIQVQGSVETTNEDPEKVGVEIIYAFPDCGDPYPEGKRLHDLLQQAAEHAITLDEVSMAKQLVREAYDLLTWDVVIEGWNREQSDDAYEGVIALLAVVTQVVMEVKNPPMDEVISKNE